MLIPERSRAAGGTIIALFAHAVWDVKRDQDEERLERVNGYNREGDSPRHDKRINPRSDLLRWKTMSKLGGKVSNPLPLPRTHSRTQASIMPCARR